MWLIDEANNTATSVSELDWAIAAGLIADPAAPPSPANDGAQGGEGEAPEGGDQPGC